LGVAINPTTGVLSWTPTEAQGPSTNTIKVKVTDNGTPTLSATNSFTVVVNEVNTAPTLSVPDNQTMNELSALVVTNTAIDLDLPANTLTFALVSGPSGVAINPVTGVLNWTPTELQGPSTNTITVKVTDNGTPALSASNSFTVVVREVNSAPILKVPPDQSINELSTRVVLNTATDTDRPVNTLTFALVNGPSGVEVDPTTGVLTWTPSEAQGPSTNTITVKVTDDGEPALSDTNSFTVVVHEVNRAPVLAVPPDQTINELSTLVVLNAASDTDLPANNLTFGLVSGPSGVEVDPITGVLTWTPSEAQGPSTNTITVKVTDDGEPALSHTNSFTVVVLEINSAPTLTVPDDQTINELNELVVTNTATDLDLPAQTLTFALVSGPSGVAVDPTTGVLTWTPTEAQGPSTNTITVRVTDDGEPALSNTNSFTVVVGEVNRAPVLAVPSDQTINELSTLVVLNAASDTDLPANLLTFALVSGPPGVVVDPTSGLLTWTPTEAQGPSTNAIMVMVTDNGIPALSATNSFTAVVKEVNSAPMLTVPGNQMIDELSELVVTNQASDTDLPGNKLTFALVSGPSGASVDPNTGVLTWTPAEAQGPSTNTITVRVTDDGEPALSHTNNFTVVVNEVNTAPVLASINSQIACVGIQIAITNSASDCDIPANLLAYSLDPGSPAGAEINPTNGVFTWTPTIEQLLSTNLVTVRVTDSGVPNLSDAKTFTIVVVSPPIIESISASEENVTISWSSLPGITYRVQFKPDPGESTWIDLPGDVTAQGPTAFKTDVIDGDTQRYYRVIILAD
jgi:hypothetical protein